MQIELLSDWQCCLAALSIKAPVHEKLANLLISAQNMSNTKQYIRSNGQAPNYVTPESYNEKMQCRKLFDRNRLFPVFCDKLAARAFAQKAGCGLEFADLYWQGGDPDQIPFDQLPSSYMVKPNQSSGAKYVVTDGARVDEAEIRTLCRKWLEVPHGQDIGEWAYESVEPRILVEKLLLDSRGIAIPDGYKFFVFSGRVAYLKHFHRVTPEHYFETYYDPTWKLLESHLWVGYERETHRVTPYLHDTPPPQTLTKMVAIAEHLAADFDHMRVDLYEVDGAVYFGELTAYSDSGFSYTFPAGSEFDTYPPRHQDYEQGALWHQPKLPLISKIRQAFSR